jgi:hypothetical protein
LKEVLWRSHFQRGYGLVQRYTTQWMKVQ